MLLQNGPIKILLGGPIKILLGGPIIKMLLGGPIKMLQQGSPIKSQTWFKNTFIYFYMNTYKWLINWLILTAYQTA